MRVTVPTGLITASNGTLRQQTDNGTTAFSWWHESHPITTYLVSLAIHTYHVYSDWYRPLPGDSMEIRFYNFPSSIPAVEPVQAKVKDMIATFARRFGEYPFLDEKYGHAEFPWGGGMEHQTCTSLGYFGEWVVAHELGTPVVGRHGHLRHLPRRLAERGFRHLLRGASGRETDGGMRPTTTR